MRPKERMILHSFELTAARKQMHQWFSFNFSVLKYVHNLCNFVRLTQFAYIIAHRGWCTISARYLSSIDLSVCSHWSNSRIFASYLGSVDFCVFSHWTRCRISAGLIRWLLYRCGYDLTGLLTKGMCRISASSLGSAGLITQFNERPFNFGY